MHRNRSSAFDLYRAACDHIRGVPVPRRVLTGAIAPLGILLTCIVGPQAWADAIFTPSDPILGGMEDTVNSLFLVGVTGTAAGTNNWPGGEAPEHIIDGVAAKYLNFAKTYTGFLINPSFNEGNGSVASSMQLWTANDSVDRDPASYEIWGTNEALDFSSTSFSLSLFTQISAGSLALPAGRGGAGTTPLNNTNSQMVSFGNFNSFKRYLIVFPTIKNATANSMQIGEVQLFGDATFVNLTWTGSVNGIWSIGTTANWANGGNPATYSDVNGVIFNDSALPAATNITIQAGGQGVKPATVVFENKTLNYTIGGEAIRSPGSLILNGTGAVTLNNINEYEKGITVNAGTLNIGAAGRLGAGALTVNNPNTGAGTAVTVNLGSTQNIGSLSGTVASPASGTNTATIKLNGNLFITQSAEGVYAGTIAGTGNLVKEGDAPLTLTGINTYTGSTTINGGILRSSAPDDNPQGALPAGQPVVVNFGATLLFGTDDGAGYYAGSVSSITVNNGAVLAATGTHSTLPKVTLNGGVLGAVGAGNFSNGAVLNYILDGDITTVASGTPSRIEASTILLRRDPLNTGGSSPLTFTVPRGTASVDLVISSSMLDKGAGFIKAGNGIVSLARASSTTGPAVISGGKVIVNHSAALGSGDVALSGGSVLSLAATPTLNGFTDFAFNGGATVDETNTVVMLTDNGGSQARSVFANTPLSVANGFEASFIYTAGGNRLADGFTFTIQNSASTAVGAPGGGLGYLGIANSAAVEFNLYTGNAQQIGTNFAIGATGSYIPSAPVNLASGNPIAIHISYDPVQQTLTETLTDQLTLATYTNTFTGVDLAAALGGTTGFVGFTGGTGGQVAAQTVENFEFNNFAKGVSLANHITIASGATAGIEVLPVSAGGAGFATIEGNVTFGANAILNVSGGTLASNAPYRLTLAGKSTLAGSATVSVTNNGTEAGSLVIEGAIGQSSPATLTKIGDGILTIAGAATYSGATTVSAGTLIVNGSISGALTTVGNTATLGGTGTLTEVSVASGGILAPGEGIGTINMSALTLQSGSILRLEIGEATSDQVKITGAATLNGTLHLDLKLTADPIDGRTFTLLNGSAPLIGYAGGARFSYQSTLLAEGQQFTVSNGGFTQAFTITYGADGGRDVALLAVIPEPGIGSCLFVGLGAVLGLRRRRK